MYRYTARLAGLIGLVILSAFSGYAQGGGKVQASYELVTVEDGLPASEVNCIVQDSAGYTWIGTNAGLSRYDGKNIVNYSTPDGLTNNHINDLYLDSKGRIWILSNGDPCYFEQNTFQVVPNIATIGAENVYSILEDQSGSIWLTTSNAVYTIADLATGPERVQLGYNWNEPRLQLADRKGVWLHHKPENGSGELVRLNQQSAQSYPLTYSPESSNYFQMVETKANSYVYNATEGLVQFDGKTEKIIATAKSLKRNCGKLRCLKMDDQGRLWLSDGLQGMLCLAFDASQPMSRKNSLLPVYEIADGRINNFYQDNFDNYWFATSDQGAGYISFNASAVRNLQVENGLADSKVLSLCGEFDQNIWIGQRDGKLSQINYTGINGVRNLDGGEDLGDITSLLSLQDGGLLIGAENGLKQLRYNRWTTLGLYKGIEEVKQAEDGIIFIGTGNALYGLTQNDLFAPVDSNLSEPPRNFQLSGNQANCLEPESGGRCWYGNDKGLFYYNGSSTAFMGSRNKLLASSITDIEKLPKGWLALTTLGEGLLLYRPTEGEVLQFNREDGIASNICTGLFFQEKEASDPNSKAALWVATNRGLSRLSALNFGQATPFEHVTYNTGDGLLSDEINAVQAMRGVLYIAGNRGLSIFNESDFQVSELPPEIYINKVFVSDQDTVLQSSYRIPFSKNSLRIRYNGISYKNRQDMQYHYMLEGLDDNWRSTYSDEMHFSSLNAGQYTFRVKAISKDGLESPQAAEVSFYIRTPFFRSWWFRLLVLASIIGLAFGAYKFLRTREERRNLQESVGMKTRQLDRKVRELKRSNEELAQFAYIASHDLKEPLRNIANYIQLIQNRYGTQLDEEGKEYMDIAVNGVKRMYDMIGGLLSYSGLVNQDTSVAKVNTNKLIDELISGIKRRPETKKVRINRKQLPTLVANPEQLRLLFVNLIDNGIKFNAATKREINLSCEENDWEYHFTLKDNGMGLDESYSEKVFMIFERLDANGEHEGSGIGLALCKKIVERHGGRIWYRSNGAGTTFHFTIRKDLENQLEPVS